MIHQIVDNYSLPEWPQPKIPYAPIGSAAQERLFLSTVSKQESAPYVTAVAELQGTVSWQSCQGSDNISYRRAVQWAKSQWSVEDPVPFGRRTIPAIVTTCPKSLPCQLSIKERYGDWSWGRFTSRYVNISFEVVP